MTIRPYPFERVPKISRAQLRAHAILDALWHEDQRGPIEATLHSLIGHAIDTRQDIQIGPAEFAASRPAQLNAGSQLALLIEPVGLALPHTFVIVLPYADAHYVVARALGGDGADPQRPEVEPLDELSAGVLAYVSARLLAALGGSLRLRDLQLGQAGQTATDRATHAEGTARPVAEMTPAPPYVSWPICVRLPGRTLQVVLHMPALEQGPSALQPTPKSRRRRHDLSALPVTLLASAGRATLPLSAARTLALGDIVVLDETDLVRDRHGVHGHATLQLAGSAHHILCALHSHTLSLESFTRPPHTPHAQGNTTVTTTLGRRIPLEDAPANQAGPSFGADAPIELNLTLARFQLTLGELQQLRVGDVLSSGRALGERVSLCVSGYAVADGELVDVDGELGVRILQVHAERTCKDGQ